MAAPDVLERGVGGGVVGDDGDVDLLLPRYLARGAQQREDHLAALVCEASAPDADDGDGDERPCTLHAPVATRRPQAEARHRHEHLADPGGEPRDVVLRALAPDVDEPHPVLGAPDP